VPWSADEPGVGEERPLTVPAVWLREGAFGCWVVVEVEEEEVEGWSTSGIVGVREGGQAGSKQDPFYQPLDSRHDSDSCSIRLTSTDLPIYFFISLFIFDTISR